MSQLRKTLEQVYVEPWRYATSVPPTPPAWDLDMLGDRMLPSAQSRHILLLCCPCSTSPSMEDLGRLAKSDASDLLEDILKVSRTRRKIMIFFIVFVSICNLYQLFISQNITIIRFIFYFILQLFCILCF